MKIFIVSLLGVLLGTQALFAQQAVADKLRLEVGGNKYEVSAGDRHNAILGEMHAV